MLPVFLLSLFCTYFPCSYYNADPTDPLFSQRDSDYAENGRSFSVSKSESVIADPVVSTKSGALNGYVMKTIRQRSIYAYEGIPYAETTGGSNRFKLAVPKMPWKGVRSAKHVGSECLQMNGLRILVTINQIYGNEDCLFLNVYTPKLPNGETFPTLPVIFWIHGGAYYLGAGSEYGPAYLLDQDVILVTINYRLGILGFLTTGDDAIPANLGLKDQALALKWVQKNIRVFGGDPSRVTIAGQSAGMLNYNAQFIFTNQNLIFAFSAATCALLI